MKSPTTYRQSNSAINASAGPVRVPEAPADGNAATDAANDATPDIATVEAQPETAPASEPQN
jgi:hypothetical protein